MDRLVIYAEFIHCTPELEQLLVDTIRNMTPGQEHNKRIIMRVFHINSD